MSSRRSRVQSHTTHPDLFNSDPDLASNQRNPSHDPNNFHYYDDDDSIASDTQTNNSDSTPIAYSEDNLVLKQPQRNLDPQSDVGALPRGTYLGHV